MRRFYFHGFLSDITELEQCLGSAQNLESVRVVDWFVGARPGAECFEDHAARVLKSLKLQADDVLIGYSMGGRLLVEGAFHLPPCRVHLLSTHPGRLTPGQASERASFANLWAERLESWEVRDFEQAWNSLDLFQGSSSRPLSGRVWGLASQWAQALRSWGPEKSHGSLQKQESLRAMSSVCWHVGERDSKYRALIESPSLGQPFQVVTGAGHRILWDQPRVWNELI